MMKFFGCFIFAPLIAVSISFAQKLNALRLEKTIPLPRVEGRIDHLSADSSGSRLFMAALGNGTVEVVDPKEGKRVHSITGLKEPQGIAYYAPSRTLFVASGGDGTLKVFDAATLQLMKTIQYGGDADNVRLDQVKKQVIVGYGDGALGISDMAGNRVDDIKLDAHPESFQLETTGQRIFVNVPKKGHIAVVDRGKHAVVGRWTLDGNQANYPMALDEKNHRLFAVCRKPARLLVFNTDSGKIVTPLECVGDSDDVFYDSQRNRIYASGGAGAIWVYAQHDADHYDQIAKVETASGARTSLFVPDLSKLFLAVPHRGAQNAAIRVYEVGE